jgi:hypothetical protein
MYRRLKEMQAVLGTHWPASPTLEERNTGEFDRQIDRGLGLYHRLRHGSYQLGDEER